jgi:rhamnosyltransferase
MNKLYNVAVLLPTYNSSEFLELQISSIFLQRGVTVKIFVYDDFSCDDTMKILKTISKTDNLEILQQDRRYGKASGSFFHLISHNKDVFINFDFVALADHDDIWLSDKIIEAINLLEDSNSNCYSSSVTSIKSTLINGVKLIKGGKKEPRQRRYDYIFEGPGPGCTFVFSSDFASELSKFISKNICGLDGVFWHDWLIYVFARLNNYKWIIDDRSFMLYIQHKNNETGVNSGFSAIVRRIRALFSGFYIHQAVQNLYLVAPESKLTRRVARLNIFDRLWLVFNIFSLRRKYFDAIVMLAFLINPFLKIPLKPPMKF